MTVAGRGIENMSVIRIARGNANGRKSLKKKTTGYPDIDIDMMRTMRDAAHIEREERKNETTRGKRIATATEMESRIEHVIVGSTSESAEEKK